jgi:pimeloyl-ACP methyl ester carboxylesterase
VTSWATGANDRALLLSRLRSIALTAAGRRLEAGWIGPGPAEAPTLVFLHDGLGAAGSWRGFAPDLAAALGCGALVYSRAGYGASDPAPLPRPVELMHDEALVTLPEILDQLEIRKAVLVGHSDGGSIALIHAAAWHDRVLALALEAPHVFVEPLTVASIAALSGNDDLKRRLERLHGSRTDETIQGWTDVWLRPEFRAWNLEALLPSVTCPVLVIQGEDDEFGTVRQVETIRTGVRGPVETHILTACGHSPHHQRKDETLALMIGFLRGHL